jgi:hypothetical protein
MPEDPHCGSSGAHIPEGVPLRGPLCFLLSRD